MTVSTLNRQPRDIAASGFSLVELVVVMAILAILAGLSVGAYDIYKQNAYNSMADGVYVQARTALEAGKIDSESFPAAAMTVEQTGPGVPDGDTAEVLVPGVVLPEDVRLFVFHRPTCADNTCIEDTISVRHCQTNRQITFNQFYQGGQAVVWNAEAEDACPAE